MMLLDATKDPATFFDRRRKTNVVVDEYHFAAEPKAGAAVVYERAIDIWRYKNTQRGENLIEEAFTQSVPEDPSTTQAILDRLAGYRGIEDPLSDAWFNARTGGWWYGGRLWTLTSERAIETILFFVASPGNDPVAAFSAAALRRSAALGGVLEECDPVMRVDSPPETPTIVFRIRRSWTASLDAYLDTLQLATREL